MDKDLKQFLEKKSRRILIPIAILWLLSLIVMLCAIFTLIWGSFHLGMKLGFSGIVCLYIFSALYKFVKETLSKLINEEINKPEIQKPVKYKFQEKLEVLQAEQRAKNK